MFITVYRPQERKELLINVDHIWKIEAEYGEVAASGDHWSTTLDEGAKNPGTQRAYRIFVGSEVILLLANPNSGVMQIIENIYKNAVKG